jgi:Ribosomal protein S3, C-terminal domain
MGQKTNPNIYQINKTNEWESKYIEKKPKDFYLHTLKDLEVKKYIYKFFKKYNLNVHNCKLNYSNNSLNIYISYQQDFKSISDVHNINEIQKINFIKNSIIKINNNISYNKIFKSVKNYDIYKRLTFKKIPFKKKYKKTSTIKRLKILNYYKKYLSLKKYKKIKNSSLNNFLNQFFKSLTLFYNKLNTISLIIEPLNSKLNKNLKKKKRVSTIKKLIKLRRYERNNFFFKNCINTILSTIRKKKSAFLLSNFIALTLQKLRRHNFFLKFLKKALKTFLSNKKISKIQGVKLRIKGRINKAPRAKNKIFTIGKLPVISTDSNIDYSETTAYTMNGTLGIKLWVCYKKNKNVKWA